MAKRKQRRSSEDVSKLLEEIQAKVNNGQSLNSACREVGVFPSLYYYHQGLEKQEKKEAKQAKQERSEEPKNVEHVSSKPSKFESNAEFELMKLKAMLYDKGIRLDQ